MGGAHFVNAVLHCQQKVFALRPAERASCSVCCHGQSLCISSPLYIAPTRFSVSERVLQPHAVEIVLMQRGPVAREGRR